MNKKKILEKNNKWIIYEWNLKEFWPFAPPSHRMEVHLDCETEKRRSFLLVLCVCNFGQDKTYKQQQFSIFSSYFWSE